MPEKLDSNLDIAKSKDELINPYSSLAKKHPKLFLDRQEEIEKNSNIQTIAELVWNTQGSRQELSEIWFNEFDKDPYRRVDIVCPFWKKKFFELYEAEVWIFGNDNHVMPYLWKRDSDVQLWKIGTDRIGLQAWWEDEWKTFYFPLEAEFRLWKKDFKFNWELAEYTYIHAWNMPENIEDKWKLDKDHSGFKSDSSTRMDVIDANLQVQLFWLSDRSQRYYIKGYGWGGIYAQNNFGLEKVQSEWHELNDFIVHKWTYELNSSRTPYIIWSIDAKKFLTWKNGNWIYLTGEVVGMFAPDMKKWVSSISSRWSVWVKHKSWSIEWWYTQWIKKWPSNSFTLEKAILDWHQMSHDLTLTGPVPFAKNWASFYYRATRFDDWWFKRWDNSWWWRNFQMEIGIKITPWNR